MRYAEWGAGSEKRVIAVNVPLLKGEVPAAQAVLNEMGVPAAEVNPYMLNLLRIHLTP